MSDDQERAALQSAGQASQAGKAEPVIFVSYRSIDDETPPDTPKRPGFVTHLQQQIKYELRTTRGVQNPLVWFDRNKIAGGDVITKELQEALAMSHIFVAVLSPNYIRSAWCRDELDCFVTPSRPRGCLFRVDKFEVAERLIPTHLQDIRPIYFFEIDEKGRKIEFYRGQIRRQR